MQGAFKYHQYQVVGRHLPTEQNENPELYRMKLWASDTVAAKSKFWWVASSPLPPPLPPRSALPSAEACHLSLRYAALDLRRLRAATAFVQTVLFASPCSSIAVQAPLAPQESSFLLCAPCRYFLRKLRKVKKANGQIIAINEVRFCLSS